MENLDFQFFVSIFPGLLALYIVLVRKSQPQSVNIHVGQSPPIDIYMPIEIKNGSSEPFCSEDFDSCEPQNENDEDSFPDDPRYPIRESRN